jgi:hypothetical protein
MRCMLAIATLAAFAALAFGVAATRAPGGHAELNAATTADRGAAMGAISYRARAVTPRNGHWRAVQIAFAKAHDGGAKTTPIPVSLLEATHGRVLWALATFALPDGTTVAERFSWRPRVGWRDLGATGALCPAVPPEVRSAWQLACR